jgi:hypothetical protein
MLAGPRCSGLGGVGSVAVALGPVVGGVLVDEAG